MIKDNNRRYKLLLCALTVLFCMVAGLIIYGREISGDQMAYDLAQLPRQQAYQIVYKQYYEKYQYILMPSGYDFPPEAVQAIFDGYMDAAKQLAPYEEYYLGQRQNIKTSCLVLTPVIMAGMLFLEIYQGYLKDRESG